AVVVHRGGAAVAHGAADEAVHFGVSVYIHCFFLLYLHSAAISGQTAFSTFWVVSKFSFAASATPLERTSSFMTSTPTTFGETPVALIISTKSFVMPMPSPDRQRSCMLSSRRMALA